MLFSSLDHRCLLAFLGLLLAGCQGVPQAGSDKKASAIRPPRLVEPKPQEKDIDFGDDWDDVEGLLSGGEQKSAKGSRPNPENVPFMAPDAPRYGICLATFIDDDHEMGGREYIQRIGMLLPAMTDGLSLHTESDHSKVLYGDFKGWKDPDVGKVTRDLRSIRIQGRQIFKTPILTEVIPPRDPNAIHPMELLSVRRAYPNARVLYTIEVAVWGDFEGGLLADNERRRLAQEYAQSLRRAGHKAWFHHNERKKMSTVTVGIFDHSAIDSDSGIHSDAVERVMSQFSARLVNGELLMEPIVPKDPGAGTRVQKPRMVEVPKF